MTTEETIRKWHASVRSEAKRGLRNVATDPSQNGWDPGSERAKPQPEGDESGPDPPRIELRRRTTNKLTKRN